MSGRLLKCTCFEEHYAVVIEHLSEAIENLPFMYVDYDNFKEVIRKKMDEVHMEWRCVNNCWDVDGVISRMDGD